MKRFVLSFLVFAALFPALAQTRSGLIWRRTINRGSVSSSRTTTPELLAYEPVSEKLYFAPAFGNEIYRFWANDAFQFDGVIRGRWSDQFQALAADESTQRLFVSNRYSVTVFEVGGSRTADIAFGLQARPTKPVIGATNVFVRVGNTVQVIGKSTLTASELVSAAGLTPLAVHPSVGVLLTDATATAAGGLWIIGNEAAPGAPVLLAGTAGLVPPNVSGAALIGSPADQLAIVCGTTAAVLDVVTGALVGSTDLGPTVGNNIRIARHPSSGYYAAGSNGLFLVTSSVTEVAAGEPAGDVVVSDFGYFWYTQPQSHRVQMAGPYAATRGPGVGISDLYIDPDSNRIYLAENRLPSHGMYKWWEGFDGNNDDAVVVQFPTECAPVSVASRPIVSDTYGGCTDNTVRWHGPLGNGSIDVPNGALDLAMAMNGSRVYAVGAGGLSVIDDATHSVTSSVPLAGAANVDIDTGTGSVFVTVPGPASGSSTLAIYNADASPIGTRTAAGAFAGIATHPNGSAYVVSRLATGSVIHIFDAGTHDLVRTISLPSVLQPVGIAIDPSTSTAYIPDAAGFSLVPTGETGYGTAHQMFVVDLTGGSVVHAIRLNGQPSAVAVNPITGRVYVTDLTTDSFSVYQIVTANPDVLTFTSVGGAPTTAQFSNITSDRESVTVAADTGTPWIPWVSPDIFSTPGTLSGINVDPSVLPAGSHSGSVFVTDPGAHVAGLPITLNLTVTGDVTVAPLSMVFTGSGTQTLSASGPFGSLVSATANVSWLTVTGGGTAPQDFQVTANGAGLPAGIHNGSITVTAPTAPAPVSVPVTLTVAVVPDDLVFACPETAARRGVAYSSVLSATGGAGSYAWSISAGALPEGLTLSGGTVAGTPVAVGTAAFALQLVSGSQLGQRSCSITVADDLQLSCPESSATMGTFYSSNALSGVSNVQWSMLGGSLPTGLTFSGGTASGTPTGPPGTSLFSIRARTGTTSDVIECSITVEAPVLRVTSGCPASGTVGVPFGPFALSATGGLGPGTYSFTSADGMLPPGVFIRDSAIQGTPTNPGAFTFAIQATSGIQVVKSSSCTMRVTVTPLKLEGGCPGTVQSGAAVSIPLTASGGMPPYRWSLAGPSWLSMQGGTVSGTAPMAAGEHAFSVTVTDGANSPAVTFSCSLKVMPPPLKVSGDCPASVAVRMPVSASFTIEGGVPPYQSSLSAPSWLSLSATGAHATVSGTPGEVGSHRYTITVTDAANTTAKYSCEVLATSPPLNIAGSCPGGIARPGSISMALAGSGGVPPYSWGVSGPAWLSVSGSGAQPTLTGTPPSAGIVSFTVTLSDAVKTPLASLACQVPVSAPTLPAMSLVVDPQRRPLTEAQPFQLQFDGTIPVALEGTIEVTFLPDVAGIADNAEVQFVDNQGAGAGRRLTIQVPAGATTVGPFLVRQGTVAGTIRLVLSSLMDGGTEFIAKRVPVDIVIARVAPVITSMVIENERSNGFDVVIGGYSTTREMRSVQLNFIARPEAQIQGASSATVEVSQLFAGFYARLAAGSAFTGLRIPVNVGGSKAAIGAVEAVLVSSAGTSQQTRVSR